MGIGITVVAGLVPALRATRIPPVAALREGSAIAVHKQSRASLLFGGFATVLGVFLLCFGIFASGIDATQRLIGMGVGCLLLFVGVAVFSPRIARPLAAVLGWPAARFFGASGRLARENAMRNPARTATTAAALMIGVALIGFITVFASSAKSSLNAAVDDSFRADLIVDAGGFGGNGVSPDLAKAISKLPEVDKVASVRVVRSSAFTFCIFSP